MQRPGDWIEFVNEPQTEAELHVLRQSVAKGRPFGREDWENRIIVDLALERTRREPGRPLKTDQAAVEAAT